MRSCLPTSIGPNEQVVLIHLAYDRKRAVVIIISNMIVHSFSVIKLNTAIVIVAVVIIIIIIIKIITILQLILSFIMITLSGSTATGFTATRYSYHNYQ